MNNIIQQECIPVGYVTPASMVISLDPEVDTPWIKRQTSPIVNTEWDRCKNITFPKLRLRAVIIIHGQ